MDFSDTFGKSLKINILFHYLTVVLNSGKEEEQNCLEYSRTHHEVLHDQFDESQIIYFMLNQPAHYEYQSLRLELLHLILANTLWRILGRITVIFHKMIFFVALTKCVDEDFIKNLL